jgi:two-component system chemotaxis sensor kinase CheA
LQLEDLKKHADNYRMTGGGSADVNTETAAPETWEIVQASAFDGKPGTDVIHVRVPYPKIDSLGDMTGELLIIQAQIEREAIKRLGANDQIVNSLLRMERIAKNIQKLSLSLRMVSLRSTFRKIARIGRDTITELGKNATLQISGEETEIDRGIVERLADPLVHIVKNAIYHGIETESERIALGKPAQGRVKIHAYSKRGVVYIGVGDDGRGISRERIYQIALEKNLVEPNKPYTDEEILALIFLPGFSTATSVDNISGRGVGLDVVKTEITRIGGKIEVDNRPGEGCGFTLKIPINLAVINGTIVETGGGIYIIPTLYIRKIVHAEPEQWVSINGDKSLLRLKDEIIPILSPCKIFGRPAEESPAGAGLLVVMELEQKFKALPVESIVDRREIVVKPLGSDFRHLDYAAGASILGDGRVSLILDVENLFKMGGNETAKAG